MIKLFNPNGTVKQEWSGALHTAPAMRQGKLLTQICGSNSVLAEIELAEGEQVGAQFTPPGEAAEGVPETTQPPAVPEPQKPRTVAETAAKLEQAGMQPREAEALATLHNDVENILSHPEHDSNST